MRERGVEGKRGKRDRGRVIVKLTECTSMCAFVSLSLRVWFIPQRVLLCLALAPSQKQCLCISAHVAPLENILDTANPFVCQL